VRSSGVKPAARIGRARLGTLLIAAGAMSACLGNPAALVSAQSSASEVETGTVEVGEVVQPAAPPPPTPANPPSHATPPAPPPGSGNGQEGTPPPGQGLEDDVSTGAPVAQSATAKTGSVSIQDGNSQSSFRFSPSSITVGSGDTVTWTNNGSEPHDVSGDGLSSGTLSPGQDYSHTFNSPGSFSYVCSIHPFMKGSVTVKGGSGGGGSESGSGGGGTNVTGPGSESDAVNSTGAAGSDTQLPTTGQPVAPLLAVGGALVALGAVLRRRPQAG
jgi:LPXTG-motif cell wall-anchored protein